VLVFMLYHRTRLASEVERTPGVAAIADRTPPPPPDAATLPEDADSAAVDLVRGDCELAARRFGTARSRHPDDPTLAWYEATSWVCAGDGTRASQALDAYLAAGGADTADLIWYQAQARLLQGDIAGARDRLVRVRPLVDLDRGVVIDRQLEALRVAAR